MKWYGSVSNRIAENVLQPIPEVGMGATKTMWSDRHAYTVLEVSKETVKYTAQVKEIGEIIRHYPKWIKASQDDAVVVRGSCMDGSAEYEFSNDCDINFAETFYFHKPSGLYRHENTKWDGREYVGTGRTTKDSQAIVLGYRDEYYDPSF